MAELGQQITDCAEQHGDAAAQAKVQEGLACLGLWADHEARWTLDKPTSFCQTLRDALEAGQWEAVLAQLDEIGRLVRKEVDLSLISNRDSPWAWRSALASMLLTESGTVDPTVLPMLRDQLDKGKRSWLLRADPITCERLLRVMIDEPQWLATMDQLSSVDPVHRRAQDMLDLWDTRGRRMPARHARATQLLQAWLTPPVQGDVGLCWLVSLNRDLHLNAWPKLLLHWENYLRNGALRFQKKDGSDDWVEPVPYAADTMSWATLPIRSWDSFDFSRQQIIAHAIDRVVPDEENSYFILVPEMKADFHALQTQAPGQEVLPLDLIQRAIARRMGLPPGFLADPDRSMEDVARHADLTQRCLWVLEAVDTPPLAMAWQAAIATSVIEHKLQKDCWIPIERALRVALNRVQWPKGMDEDQMVAHIERLRELFMRCATLQLDWDAGLRSAMFRLRLKQAPDAPGQGMRIGGAEQLIARLDRLSRQVEEDAPVSPLGCHSLLAAALSEPGFHSAIKAPTKDGQASYGVWLSDTDGGAAGARGDLEAGARAGAAEWDQIVKTSNKKSDYFFIVHAGSQQYAVGVKLRSRGKGLSKRQSPSDSLSSLVLRLRSLDQGLLPFDFRAHLKEHGGELIVGAKTFEKAGGSHRFALEPLDGAFLPLWQNRTVLPKLAIRQQLTDPMKAGLQQVLSAKEAKTWLGRVVAACPLKAGATVGAVADQVLAKAQKDQKTPGGGYKLRALLLALEKLSISGSNSPFAKSSPQDNGLSMAVLNHFPGGAPVVPIGRSNWGGGSTHLAYWVDPFTRKVSHGVGAKRVGVGNQWSFEFDRLSDAYFF